MQTYIVKFAFDPEWPEDRIRPHIRTYTAEADSVEQVLGEWLGGEFGIKTLKISSKDADGNTTVLKEIHNPRRIDDPVPPNWPQYQPEGEQV
jgi:hypothetical protein